MQSQRYTTAGLASQKFQCFQSSYTHAVFACIKTQPSPIAHYALNDNLPRPVRKYCSCDSVSFTLHECTVPSVIAKDVTGLGVSQHLGHAHAANMCHPSPDGYADLILKASSCDIRKLSLLLTSTAHPIQSKPGPKLAIVAGAKAVVSCTTGSMYNFPPAWQQSLTNRYLRWYLRMGTLNEGISAVFHWTVHRDGVEHCTSP